MDYKKLGFSSVEEMMLYKDVCAGRDVNYPESLEELLYNLQNNIEDTSPTKEDYQKFMKENNLIELLNNVESMSVLDRMLKIAEYYYNGVSVTNTMRIMLIGKIKDAQEMFDGEKEIEYQGKLSRVDSINHEYLGAISYISDEAIKRLSPDELKVFSEITKEQSDFVIKPDGNNTKQR